MKKQDGLVTKKYFEDKLVKSLESNNDLMMKRIENLLMVREIKFEDKMVDLFTKFKSDIYDMIDKFIGRLKNVDEEQVIQKGRIEKLETAVFSN